MFDEFLMFNLKINVLFYIHVGTGRLKIVLFLHFYFI